MNSRTVLSAIQHIRKMNGKTQSHLLRANDGNLHITKFSNNPLGIRVLANEFLATRIGLSLGLPMPEVSVIEISDLLIKGTPALKMKTEAGDFIRCAPGRHLAIRYVADLWQERVFDYLPKACFNKVSNKEDFARILPFDKWLGNCDARQAVYVSKIGSKNYQALFIDQHDCFDGARWQFLDHPEFGTHSPKHVYESVTGWEAFEPVLSKIEQVGAAELSRLAGEIPPEWYGQDSLAIFQLIEMLEKRRSLIRGFISSFRSRTPNPFPSWR